MKLNKLFIVMLACLSIVIAAGCYELDSNSNTTTDQKAAAGKSIGIYDSRCIAIAYYNSDIHKKFIDDIAAKHKAATEAGDMEKAKGYEEQMAKFQQLAHSQGFGTEPVDDLLEKVTDDINKLKAKQGIDLVVSKWDYKGDLSKCVDVTDELVGCYQPDAKVIKWINDIKKKQPVSIN